MIIFLKCVKSHQLTIYYVSRLGMMLFSLITPSVFSLSQNCCLQRGGICNEAQCCDGTSIPIECGDFKIVKLPPIATPSSQQLVETETTDESPLKWLYAWHDLDSGTLHLSSTAPPWYRNAQYQGHYPHVLVYDEYYRLIDDTEKKLDPDQAAKLRQAAQLKEQQYSDYQKLKKKEVALKARNQRLNTLLKAWMSDGQITEALTQMLEEVAQVGQVSLGMTKKQVEQAWGKPQTVLEVKHDESSKKYQEILKYQKGIVTFFNGRVKSLKSNP